MEEGSIQNQQNISGGQGWQVNDPTAPIVQGNNNTVNIVNHPPLQPELKVSGTPHNLPYSGAIAFVGREDDLKRLHEQLQTETTIAISSISGMGGIGKTELAWQYANQQLGAEPPLAAVCWLRAREDLGAQILAFGQGKLGLKVSQEWDFAQQVEFCWDQLRQSEALVIFDDVQKFEDVRAFLAPVRSRCKILLTTRAKFGQGVQPFEIKVLKEIQALDLLRAIVGDGRIDADLETAKQVCQWLGCLPLGLELVGRYLTRKPDTSVATLWKRLQEKRLDAISLKQGSPEMTATLGVAAAFELSWQELDELSQRVAAFLSLFALAPIPWTLVQEGFLGEDPEELEEVRDRKLVELSLLTRTGQGMYEMHQLLREFFAVKRSQMREDGEMKRLFCCIIIEESRKISDLPSRDQIEQIAPSIPHIAEAAVTLELSLRDEDALTPFVRIAWFHQGQAAYLDATLWHEKALAVVKRRLGDTHIDVATASHNLARIYYLQGKLDKIETLLISALEIYKQHLNCDHSRMANIFVELAELYHDQGRYYEAELRLSEAKAIYENSCENNRPEIASVLNNLACLYKSLGRYQDAKEVLSQALIISEYHWGKDHPRVASSLNNLAGVYEIRGDYSQAEAYYSRSLKINQNYYGLEHPTVATSLNNLAGLKFLQERYKEAKQLYFEALKLSCGVLGENHPKTLKVWRNIRELIATVLCKNRVNELF